MEPRWPVALTVLAVISLITLLPSRVRVLPTWVGYLAATALIVPMVAIALTTAKLWWLRIESIVTALFLVIAGFATLETLSFVLSAMVRRSAEVTGLQLLSSSVAVWAINVLVFSIIYWRTDRGGPEARASHACGRPDWLFPQEGVPDKVGPDWRPTYIDYLFLSYCTATAFSPAEGQPLTARGMLLLMLESLISLVTIIVVAARAINILGS